MRKKTAKSKKKNITYTYKQMINRNQEIKIIIIITIWINKWEKPIQKCIIYHIHLTYVIFNYKIINAE